MKIVVVLVVAFMISSCGKKVVVDENNMINPIDSVCFEEESIVEDTIVPLTIKDLASLRIPYLQDIVRSSKTYSLYPELVAGIIKQESRFIHNRVSPANAIGLMQVVPGKAGHEVNKIFYKKDEPIADSLLYNPSFNIKVGCAYIYYLKKYYFSGIRNEISRRYCVISAYNTGVGNVVKALVSESDTESIEGYDKLKGYEKFKVKMQIATYKVNSMNHAEVKEYLKNNLPYAETRDYLEKVTAYIDEWKDTINSIEQVAVNLP